MTKIIQRHDTAANWTTINPILASGEMGVETDTNKFKFGDGVTAWASLAYAAGEGGSGSGTTLTSTDGTTTYNKLALGDKLVVIPPDIPWTNPQMTSNSQDGYVASASVSSSSTGSAIWKAFNKDTTSSEDCWYTGSVSMPQWIMLECPEPVRLTSCMIANEVATPVNFKSGYIQGSNDGNTFDTLYTITDRPNTTGLKETYTFTNDVYYKYLRVYCTASYGSGLSIQEIEFSGFTKDATAVSTLNVDAYTKTETDSLLSDKQDKLIAEAPIKIYAGNKQIPNVTLHDGATIGSDSIYHGANGPYLSFNPGVDLSTASSWEYRIKIKFPSWTTPTGYPYQALVINSDYTSNYQLVLNFIHDGSSVNKRTIMYLSSNGTSWNIPQPTKDNSPFVEGGIYYISFGFTGSQYYIKYNETGWSNSFTTIASQNTSTKIVSSNLDSQLGGPVQPFYGDIYLEESSLTVNGGVAWTGTRLQSGVPCITANPATTSSLGVVQPDGTSITVSETGVISGQDVKTFTGYSDTGTLVLKSINGALQWVAEA